MKPPLKGLIVLSMLVAPAAAADHPAPPKEWRQDVSAMARSAREGFRSHPGACEATFNPDAIRRFLLVYTAGRRRQDDAVGSMRDLALDAAACESAVAGDPGACTKMAEWEGREGERLGARARLAKACAARREEARFWRAIFIDRAGEEAACRSYLKAQDWDPYRDADLGAVCAAAVPALRGLRSDRCAELGRYAGGGPHGVGWVEENCRGLAAAGRSYRAADCAPDDRSVTSGCPRFARFAGSVLGGRPCRNWDCARPLDRRACAGARAALASAFCKSLDDFMGERADEALYRTLYQ